MVSQKLEVRHSQSLVMTQALRQSIELLQMSSVELEEFISQEVEKNPLLQTGSEEQQAPTEPQDQNEDKLTREQQELSDEMEKSDYENLWDGERGEKDYAEQDAAYTTGDLRYNASSGDFDESPNLEKYVSAKKSLKDHLEDQLYMDVIDPVKRMIGLHLIDIVDDSGYLGEDAAALHKQLGCEKKLVDDTISMLQKFDPAGVFARSLKECLALQLEELNHLDPAMEKMLDNLDLVAKKDLKGLQKVCGVDGEDIADMLSEIKALNPKPGLAYAASENEAVLPDVLVTRSGGSWRVELNMEAMPRVLVNNSYYRIVSEKAKSKEEKKYLSENLSNANWLVRAVEQRADSILKVATEIVNRQMDFLKHGVTYLKPMVLKDISEAVGVHESTVSRVTSNKYMLTPRGMYEMKYFFTSGISSAFGGDSHSSEAVKFKIKKMVDSEDPENILSDDELADMLKEEGMDIARRTVAKYREAMGIGSSVQRRREKRLLGVG